MPASSVARQLAASPVMVFPIRIERALDVAIQCPHDADARGHRRPSQFGDRHQALNRGLPMTRCTMQREGSGFKLASSPYQKLRSRSWHVS
jgi:hypothetical protein